MRRRSRKRRFQEDALRILRCLRFSSALEFDIEETTGRALLARRELLKNIAPERIGAEFSKLILGGRAEQVLTEYLPVFRVFFGRRPACACFPWDLLPAKKEIRLAGVFSAAPPKKPRWR